MTQAALIAAVNTSHIYQQAHATGPKASTTTAPHLIGGKPSFDPAVFVRLPSPRTRCAITGLSRSSMAELVRPCKRNDWLAPVEAVVLKKRHANRGCLLINKASLLAYLSDLPRPIAAQHGKDGAHE